MRRSFSVGLAAVLSVAALAAATVREARAALRDQLGDPLANELGRVVGNAARPARQGVGEGLHVERLAHVRDRQGPAGQAAGQPESAHQQARGQGHGRRRPLRRL